MAEIPLVFGTTGLASLNATFTTAEQILSDRFMRSFAAFARNGGVDDPSWVAFEATQRVGLVINETAVAGPLGDAAAVCVDIWDHTGYVH